MGLEFHAIVHVQLTRHDREGTDAFIAAVQGRHEVQECYATTGQSDYHLRVLCRDLGAFNRFLEEFLYRQPAVASAQTNVVLRTVKPNGPVTI
jgi:Lrp/AsnC family transcriptional regulator, leucine-responsive regulatory protein